MHPDLALFLADLERDGALTTDPDGRMVFVGLTYEETVEYLTVKDVKGRKTFAGTDEEWLAAVKRRVGFGAPPEEIRRALVPARYRQEHY